VAQARMTCHDLRPTGAFRAHLLGGQETYVKLTSAGTAFDGGTQILSSNVTVQNLLRENVGTTDGSTVTGVDVFFAADPTVTSGSGSVAVNADGVGTFTATNQPYYHYDQILAPYEISASRAWAFQLTGSVTTFEFTVYVAAPVVDEQADLLDRVWEGGASSAWLNSANWENGVPPDSASTVAIPADSMLADSANQPVLSADAFLTNLRVGYASSLALGGNTLTAYGNVDAVGAVTGGRVKLVGSGALLSGTVDQLQVTGSTRLQGATVATGAVSVTGTLTATNQTLTIKLP
jgi:hypothetical protein